MFRTTRKKHKHTVWRMCSGGKSDYQCESVLKKEKKACTVIPFFVREGWRLQNGLLDSLPALLWDGNWSLHFISVSFRNKHVLSSGKNEK